MTQILSIKSAQPQKTVNLTDRIGIVGFCWGGGII